MRKNKTTFAEAWSQPGSFDLTDKHWVDEDNN